MNPTIKKILINALTMPLLDKVGWRAIGHGVPIFMLHRVHSDASSHRLGYSTTYLRKCLTYLRDRDFNFLSLYELISLLRDNKPIPPKSIVFTQDDGFEDQASIAAPVFVEFNCPVTIFLISDMLDGKLWPWDDKVAYAIKRTERDLIEIEIGDEHISMRLDSEQTRAKAREIIRNTIKAFPSDDVTATLAKLETATGVTIPTTPPAEYQPMTWELAREYEKKGVHFAPHTMTHRILSKMDAETMKSEILGSWQRLKEELASPKPVFAYPTGRYCDFGSREVRFLRETEIIGAVSTIPAQVRPEKYNNYYIYSLPRYSLPESFDDFRMYCSWIEYTKERNLKFWPS